MKIQKVGKLAANLHDRKEYGISIRNLKQPLYHRSVLKKLHTFIQID